ncbi:BgTH12-00452 [Blumeria graminis f. sp. triticale]|uniref:BgTH12-00452 n=1 Tax=Blumeria graminis f. sp. triticale TaxID=1689686 RepID=A0A9W4GHJ1_BLUGR|nr:BgTH12-00452 [Blumeria graminis f. sp. triticale]
MRILIALLLLSPISIITAQKTPDGSIVPFSSRLPACASKCGPLYDVQGKCSPPVTTHADNDCFCADARLTSFKTGPAGVSSVCGATICTLEDELEKVQEWYLDFCGRTATRPDQDETSDDANTPDQNNTSSQSWISGHFKWVIMVSIIFLIIISAWILACICRRRYLRKKEKEVEMAPPVAWGPHQLQSATGGYSRHDGSAEKSRNIPLNASIKTSTTILATPIDTVTTNKEDSTLKVKKR